MFVVITKIIHIDMDAFYASVEQMDHPELKGRPVAVGGNGERGVVAAASYEARKFGVHSAMPSVIAARRCQNLIFVKPRFERYKELSHQIRDIFYDYTHLVEPLSLDEAYLDVTKNKTGSSSATFIAQEIKRRIRVETGLIASAGISYNKFLAKTASDADKPDGLYVILPEEALDFLERLPVRDFHGIGRVTAEKLVRAGIFTGKDLKEKSLEDLKRRFGKSGQYFYDIVRGVDHRAVQPHREVKSISAERTLDDNIVKRAAVLEALQPVLEKVWSRYLESGKRGFTVTLKLKYTDFQQVTRSQTLEEPVHTFDSVQQVVNDLVTQEILRPEGIRLVGMGLSNFREVTTEANPQLTLQF